MTNKDVAKQFRELAQLMELHQENPFRIRSYQSAYMTLRKLDEPVIELSETELAKIKGIGKAISSKIRELAAFGHMETLEKYRAQTPEGVRDMLGISGFGPKKIRVVWQELGATSIGELLYAVNENRLITLKGFGVKTQEDLKKKLAYFQLSKGKFLYAKLESEASILMANLQQAYPSAKFAYTGTLRRAVPTLERIQLLASGVSLDDLANEEHLINTSVEELCLKATTVNGFPVTIYFATAENWGSKQFRYTATPAFMSAFLDAYPNESFTGHSNEKAVFEQVGLAFLPPELRETDWGLNLARNEQIPDLLEVDQIRGIIHTHTTYSDGIHNLEEMATYARSQGYEYIGVTDHSQAAFYANGLKVERVLEQFAAIDKLNATYTDFRILKGIESDILADGSLDYPEDILAQFDFIIASVHANLRMDENKATTRLLRAIENPYTSILGHPTGRLLLSRPGYPIDHQRIIDACAANNVAIEINASPYRLDLDWQWIPYAIEKGVLLSVNPDAHSREGIHDIRYGTLVGRKGGLTAKHCLNAYSVDGFLTAIKKI